MPSSSFGCIASRRPCSQATRAPSRVLKRAGFIEEGLARRYLKINGVWQDHLVFAILAEDWMTREVQGLTRGALPSLRVARARGSRRSWLPSRSCCWRRSSRFPRLRWHLKPIEIGQDQGRLDVTPLADLYEGRGDSLQVETAAGADGLASRMSRVGRAPRATTPTGSCSRSPTPRTSRSSAGCRRHVTAWSGPASYGRISTRSASRRLRRPWASCRSASRAIARICSASRSSRDRRSPTSRSFRRERFARLHLWKPLDYEIRISNRQLFNGVLLGLTGLMAIFLTAIFAANHKLVFPASALVAWCVLAHLCVDFGFFHKLFQLKPEANAVYRAASEAALAASLVVFLHRVSECSRCGTGSYAC